jgi:charged multivesicular body protein 4
MSILFGKAKKQPTTKESIMQLRESVDMLEKREKLLQTKIETELKSAQANRTKNKKGKSCLWTQLNLSRPVGP